MPEADAMRALAPPVPPEGRGVRLTSPEYKRDFRERQKEIHDASSWKLERRQYFEEQGDPSRDALRRGDWDAALRVFAEERDAVVAKARENRRRRYTFHRVRVIDGAITPYLQWELHSLLQQAELGANRVRVVTDEAVAEAETVRPLPEMVVLGSHTLYQVLYTEDGVPLGAVRFTAPETVLAWERYITSLYAEGEDITSYFAREIAPLAAPVHERHEPE
ncbi:DUF6879 family protein [Streptomyces sp. 8L]|uniref:DUF6879 family protein n=1 Tax=Streptomyces sp. 8L TaxID=2877242 RepID=UPI001CD1AC4F|nr:DUF6879 family protein [Streptomyces sp. 8L]MCA1218041.1 hypothetical protein [Streptomyces sp. 8L]